MLNNIGRLGKYSSDFMQNFAKKHTRVLLCSANAWIRTHAMFPVIPKQCCLFSLIKVFSLSLQHIRCTYRANIHDQLIENTTIVSVDVILSV